VGEKRRASGSKAAAKKAKVEDKSPTRDLLPLMTGGEMRSYQARYRSRQRVTLARAADTRALAAQGRQVDHFAVPERAERHPG
jgi:hypothetical protein